MIIKDTVHNKLYYNEKGQFAKQQEYKLRLNIMTTSGI